MRIDVPCGGLCGIDPGLYHIDSPSLIIGVEEEVVRPVLVAISLYPKPPKHLVPSPDAIAKAFNVSNVMYWSQCPAYIKFLPILGKCKLI